MANAICNFEKFTNAYYTKIAKEIMLLLVNNVHEKSITESQDRRNFALVLQLCTCVT